jgi:hypothetical protein
MRAWIDRINDGLSGMPADGISLPPKRGDFGTSRWAGSKVRLHQPRDWAEGGHDRLWWHSISNNTNEPQPNGAVRTAREAAMLRTALALAKQDRTIVARRKGAGAGHAPTPSPQRAALRGGAEECRYGPPDRSAAQRRPLSRGSSPCGYPHKPLVSYRINRQLSGWNLPPLMIRAFGRTATSGH